MHALRRVAHVEQQHGSARFLIVLFELRDCRIAPNASHFVFRVFRHGHRAAMDVVRMDDHKLAFQALFFGHGRNRHGQRHCQHENPAQPSLF